MTPGIFFPFFTLKGEDFKLTIELSEKVRFSHNQAIKNGLRTFGPIHFGLDLCRFVKELCAQKRKHSIILNLHSELNREVAVVKSLEEFIS